MCFCYWFVVTAYERWKKKNHPKGPTNSTTQNILHPHAVINILHFQESSIIYVTVCVIITVRCDANRDLIFSLHKPGGTKNASRVERSTTQSPATLTVIQKKKIFDFFKRSVYSRIKKKCKQRSSSFISCLGRHDWKRAKDINVGSTVSSFDTIFCRHDLIFWWVKKKKCN